MLSFRPIFLWAGGATFAVALAGAAYCYVVVWSAPVAAGDWLAPAAANTVGFTVFALHHSLFARERVKSVIERFVPRDLIRSVYVWTASLLLLGVLALWQRVPGDLYQVTGWRAMALTAVQLMGVWLIARSVARIDALELAGIRPQGCHTDLQTAGPYRWVRHPVYLGWMLAAFAAAHMTGDRLTFAAITTIYLLIAVPWEERSLRRTYGESYARYQRAVPWRVVPYVY
jgi:protein-S-isoprenylcysteine O-methyltransferase Ste14